MEGSVVCAAQKPLGERGAVPRTAPLFTASRLIDSESRHGLRDEGAISRLIRVAVVHHVDVSTNAGGLGNSLDAELVGGVAER